MQRLEVSGAVRPIYKSLGVKGLIRGGGQDFSNSSRAAPWPVQPPVQCVPDQFPRVERPRRGVDHDRLVVQG